MKEQILEVKQFESDIKLHRSDEDGAIYKMQNKVYSKRKLHINSIFLTFEQLRMIAHNLDLVFEKPSDLEGKNVDHIMLFCYFEEAMKKSKTSIILINPADPRHTINGYEEIEINNQYDDKEWIIKINLLKEGIEVLRAHYGTILFKEKIPIATYEDDNPTAALYAHLMQLKGISFVPVP